MKYTVFYHTVENEFNSFLSAGILVEDEDGKEIRRIFDVSTDFSAVEEFTDLLNKGDVHLEHFDCMLEDYYSEHY